MQILAAIALTILPGSWIVYGLRVTGVPRVARLAMAVALSPAVVGLQLAVLEAVGLSFGVSAVALVLLNLPCAVLLIHRLRSERMTASAGALLPSLPLLAMLVAIPLLLWSLIPGLRTYEWETMLHTDVIYTIARDGVHVEEANLAGLSLAYGWIGHSYWAVIGWLGDWAPTMLYPFTNLLWLILSFILSYQLGRSGLGFQRATALLATGLMFLSTNIVGMLVLIVAGYSQSWERYFGDIRYSPLLSKFYAFDTMLWGMTLLIAMALVYTIALRRRVAPLDGLTIALLVGLGLIYPVLFPAGLLLAGCFLLLSFVRVTADLPQYTRWEMARLGLAILLSGILVWLYLGLMTADREVATFALSTRADIRLKLFRFLGAMLPFMLLAVLPFIGFIRRRHGPALLLGLSAIGLSAAYIVIDLAQLEYKYVLAATVCGAFLAAAALDPFFERRPRLGQALATLIAGGLVAINLLFVFQSGMHLPGNLDQGAPVNEDSFWIALKTSEPDSAWTTAIRERTPQDTVVIAQRPGVQLSVLVGRSMYIPSDLDGSHLPGYNLNQRFYLLEQRGYPTDLYNRRLAVVEILYTSEDEARILEALDDLKELRRPVAIYFPTREIYSLQWLEQQGRGRSLISDGPNTVWLMEDLSALP